MPMVVAGLTGSIAMGKSTVAAMFATLGAPVFDADAAVEAVYAGEGALTIEQAFPGVLADGKIDKALLAKQVLGDRAALKRLEALVHPAVSAAQSAWIAKRLSEAHRSVILDVPLLLETGGDRSVDVVIVVSAPHTVQRMRALKRAAMTEAKLDAILSRQMSDSEKRRRAHAIIDTGGSLERTRRQAEQVLRAIGTLNGRVAGHT